MSFLVDIRYKLRKTLPTYLMILATLTEVDRETFWPFTRMMRSPLRRPDCSALEAGKNNSMIWFIILSHDFASCIVYYVVWPWANIKLNSIKFLFCSEKYAGCYEFLASIESHSRIHILLLWPIFFCPWRAAIFDCGTPWSVLTSLELKTPEVTSIK